MKSYEEMAKSVFEKRDAYLESKKSRKLNTALVVSTSAVVMSLAAICIGVFLMTRIGPTARFLKDGDGGWQGGAGRSENEGVGRPESSMPSSSAETPSSSEKAPSSIPESSLESSSEEKPPVSEPSVIDSFDELNYYTGLLSIKRASMGGVAKLSGETHIMPDEPPTDDPLDDPFISHTALPRYKTERFTVSRAYYFEFDISDPDNFIAEKIGTGRISAVITDNDFGIVITFKNGNDFYSLLGEEDEGLFSFNFRSYIDGDYAFYNRHVYPLELKLSLQYGIILKAVIEGDSSDPDSALSLDIVSGSQRGGEFRVSLTYAELEKLLPDVLK